VELEVQMSYIDPRVTKPRIINKDTSADPQCLDGKITQGYWNKMTAGFNTPDHDGKWSTMDGIPIKIKLSCNMASGGGTEEEAGTLSISLHPTSCQDTPILVGSSALGPKSMAFELSATQQVLAAMEPASPKQSVQRLTLQYFLEQVACYVKIGDDVMVTQDLLASAAPKYGPAPMGYCGRVTGINQGTVSKQDTIKVHYDFTDPSASYNRLVSRKELMTCDKVAPVGAISQFTVSNTGDTAGILASAGVTALKSAYASAAALDPNGFYPFAEGFYVSQVTSRRLDGEGRRLADTIKVIFQINTTTANQAAVTARLSDGTFETALKTFITQQLTAANLLSSGSTIVVLPPTTKVACTCTNGQTVSYDCDLGQESCSTCNPGYHVTPSQCQAPTMLGSGLQSAASVIYAGYLVLAGANQQPYLQVSNCVPGSICKANVCVCANGLPASVATIGSGAVCGVNGANTCSQCNAGYHLNTATKACEANVCVCANGLPAASPCAIHQGNICQICARGYHLDSVTCKANVCTCLNGYPAQHPDQLQCETQGSADCSSCHQGFHLVASSANVSYCKENVCQRCGAGKAATGQPQMDPHGNVVQCMHDGGMMCLACDLGYHLVEKSSTGIVTKTTTWSNATDWHNTQRLCMPNKCTCSNGVAGGTTIQENCPVDGKEHCVSCETGWHIKMVNVTSPICELNKCYACPNGRAAHMTTCVEHGRVICDQCNAGWNLVRHPDTVVPVTGAKIPNYDTCEANQCYCDHGTPAVANKQNLIMDPVLTTSGIAGHTISLAGERNCFLVRPGYNGPTMETVVNLPADTNAHQCCRIETISLCAAKKSTTDLHWKADLGNPMGSITFTSKYKEWNEATYNVVCPCTEWQQLSHRITMCTKPKHICQEPMHQGYHLYTWFRSALVNVCTCRNGKPAAVPTEADALTTPISQVCTKHMEEKCQSCEDGYILVGQVCEAQCYCANGEAGLGINGSCAGRALTPRPDGFCGTCPHDHTERFASLRKSGGNLVYPQGNGWCIRCNKESGRDVGLVNGVCEVDRWAVVSDNDPAIYTEPTVSFATWTKKNLPRWSSWPNYNSFVKVNQTLGDWVQLHDGTYIQKVHVDKASVCRHWNDGIPTNGYAGDCQIHANSLYTFDNQLGNRMVDYTALTANYTILRTMNTTPIKLLNDHLSFHDQSYPAVPHPWKTMSKVPIGVSDSIGLLSGRYCIPTCMPGFTLTSASYCLAGKLHPGTCQAPAWYVSGGAGTVVDVRKTTQPGADILTSKKKYLVETDHMRGVEMMSNGAKWIKLDLEEGYVNITEFPVLKAPDCDMSINNASVEVAVDQDGTFMARQELNGSSWLHTCPVLMESGMGCMPKCVAGKEVISPATCLAGMASSAKCEVPVYEDYEGTGGVGYKTIGIALFNGRADLGQSDKGYKTEYGLALEKAFAATFSIPITELRGSLKVGSAGNYIRVDFKTRGQAAFPSLTNVTYSNLMSKIRQELLAASYPSDALPAAQINIGGATGPMTLQTKKPMKTKACKAGQVRMFMGTGACIDAAPTPLISPDDKGVYPTCDATKDYWQAAHDTCKAKGLELCSPDLYTEAYANASLYKITVPQDSKTTSLTWRRLTTALTNKKADCAGGEHLHIGNELDPVKLTAKTPSREIKSAKDVCPRCIKDTTCNVNTYYRCCQAGSHHWKGLLFVVGDRLGPRGLVQMAVEQALLVHFKDLNPESLLVNVVKDTPINGKERWLAAFSMRIRADDQPRVLLRVAEAVENPKLVAQHLLYAMYPHGVAKVDIAKTSMHGLTLSEFMITGTTTTTTPCPTAAPESTSDADHPKRIFWCILFLFLRLAQ
jgi:hypothetical protein